MSCNVYLIKSNIDSSYYVGISKNPQKRLIEHNSGKLKMLVLPLPKKQKTTSHLQVKQLRIKVIPFLLGKSQINSSAWMVFFTLKWPKKWNKVLYAEVTLLMLPAPTSKKNTQLLLGLYY